MLNAQNVFVTASVFAVTFLVPTIVGITLIAGLLQLIYGQVHRAVDGLSAGRKLAQRSVHELKSVP
jgi:hypothetical protein